MSYLSGRDDQADERARLHAELDRRMASDGPVVEHDDLGAVFRTLRDTTGLSQRELARRAGVPQRTVARIEAGASTDARWSTVLRVLRASGCRLQLLGPDGRPPVPWVFEPGRDSAGRHLPARLAVTLSRENRGRGGTDAFYRRRTPTYEWSQRGREWDSLLAPADEEPEGITGDADGPMLGG